jgi:mono/diheme cytochrome c family protein
VPGDGDEYIHDRSHRRAVLEAALWQPELPYSKSLLNNYALESGGWELLPELSTASAPFTTADAERLAQGQALELDAVTNGQEAGKSVGEQVFFEQPMRFDAYLTWIAARPELWDAVGLKANDDGRITGLVKFDDDQGQTQVGMSCALCHSVDGVPGRAKRTLDLGLVRALYAESRGVDGDIYRTWGPGRLDVTDDGVNGPTAIPDLWGLKHASHLNHSGVIEVSGIDTLAVRFETQFILGHRLMARPQRSLIWALAEFVWELAPQPTAVVGEIQGKAIFQAQCSACHKLDQGGAGALIDANTLTSDSTVAFTPNRGTGYYKVPSLMGVSQNGPWLHDGSQPSLKSLLQSGHPHGAALVDSDRSAVINFLKSL